MLKRMEVSRLNRAERRRTQKSREKVRTVTYNLTKEQLDILVQEQIKTQINKARLEGEQEAMDKAFVLMLTLPMMVLKDCYWKKTYTKKLPEFCERVLEYYEKWLNGEVDMDILKDELWECAGVRMVEGDGVNV